MHPSNNDETSVEDTRGRGVPPLLEEDEVGVLEERAAVARRRSAGGEQPDGLVPGLDNGVSGEPDLVSTDASLSSKSVVIEGVVRHVIDVLTIVPLLRKAPLPQNELVTTSRALTSAV